MKTYMKAILAIVVIAVIAGAYFGGYYMGQDVGYDTGSDEGYVEGYDDAAKAKPPRVMPKGYLIVGQTDEPVYLDPAKAYDWPSCNVIQNVFEGLVTYTPGTTDLIPGLAENWTISPDGKVYTFNLRNNVTFHDGTKFNATAVKHSIERAIALEGDPSFLLDAIAGIVSVDVVDTFTVKFTLKAPNVVFLSIMAFTVAYPVSPAAYPADEFKLDIAVGTGPYKLVKWSRGVEMVLEANKEYWWEEYIPKNDVTILRFHKKPETLRLAIEAHEVDIALRKLRATDWPELEEKTDLVVYKAAGPTIRYIVIDVTQAPFTDKLVRQAIACAINRTTISETVYLGEFRPLYSMVPDGMFSHIDAFKDKWGERDLDNAKTLLGQAGYSTANPLVIDFWCETGLHYGMEIVETAEMIEAQLEETGMIEVTLKYSEWATYIDDVTSRQHKMPIFLLGWYPDYLDPDNYLSPFVESESDPFMGCWYNSTVMDGYLHDALVETDVDARSALYESAQTLMAEDCPIIPLLGGEFRAVALTNVKGIVLDVLQIFRYYLIYKE